MYAHQSVALIAQSPVMRSIIDRVRMIAPSVSSVLLIGETGVGKELMAEYIQKTSNRETGPFIKVSLSALPHELLESELFGHEKGAYTSAASEKKGFFELADTGSIFLDDIDDFPLHLQSKLLRVLESQELVRVGGTTSIPLDVRLITASKVDLKELVDRRLFRADLYYRINVVPFVIPPLRERIEDIPLLVQHFLRRYAGGRDIRIDPEVIDALLRYSWPGNVRELRNLVQRTVLFANGSIRLADLPPEVRTGRSVDLIVRACSQCIGGEGMSFDQVVNCLEAHLLQQAMEKSRGNRTHAARALGMSLSSFRDKLKKHGLDDHASPEIRVG